MLNTSTRAQDAHAAIERAGEDLLALADDLSELVADAERGEMDWHALRDAAREVRIYAERVDGTIRDDVAALVDLIQDLEDERAALAMLRESIGDMDRGLVSWDELRWRAEHPYFERGWT